MARTVAASLAALIQDACKGAAFLDARKALNSTPRHYREQEAQSQDLNRLKLVYGLLAYMLAHENPAVKTALDQKIQEMEQVENSDNIYKGPILKSLNEEKESFEKQLTDVHNKCLQHLLEEEDLLTKLEGVEIGFTLDSVDQIDGGKNKVDKKDIPQAELDALRDDYNKTKDELKKNNPKKGKPLNKRKKSVGHGVFKCNVICIYGNIIVALLNFRS